MQGTLKMAKTETFNFIRIIPRETDFLQRRVGARGEIFLDRENQTLRFFDGEIQGGATLARTDLKNIDIETLEDAINSAGSAFISYTVTINNTGDGNKYILNGDYKPVLNFVAGYTYEFNQDDSTNVYYPNATGTTNNQHPLNFSADDPNGEAGDGTVYTAGVTYLLDNVAVNKQAYWDGFESATSRRVRIKVTTDTPSVLYYWCQNHLNMGNEIAVAVPGTGSGSSLDITYTADENLDWAAGSYDFGNNIIKYSNAVQLESELSNYSPATYHGMTMHVHESGALYYAHAGEWRKLVTDTSYGDPVSVGYTDPLNSIAYDGLTLSNGTGISIQSPSPNSFTVSSTGLQSLAFSVQGQTTLEQTSDTGSLNLVGNNLSISTDEESNTITFTAPQAVTQAFTRITVSGESDIVADQAEDAFQLVAGPNISISTSPGGDSITISGTSGDGEASGVSTGQANRLARYASTGQVIQDTGENLIFDGTNLILNGSPVVTASTETKTEFFIAADDSTIRLVRNQESVKFIGGTGITTTSDVDGNITITNTSTDQNIFSTISVAGQDNITADTTSDTLTFAAGSNITLTNDALSNTVTIAAAGGGIASNTFETIAVSGQSDVVADNSTDTLTLVAGSGIVITTDADNNSITVASSAATPDLFQTVEGDNGSVTADSPTETLTIAGGTDISTSVSGNTLTIGFTGSAGAANFSELGDATDASLTVDDFYLPAITKLIVDNNLASAYTFDQYSGDNPTIYAISGLTIAFDLNNIQGHPFLVQDPAGSNYSTGLVHVDSDGTVSEGTNAQGKTSGTLYWKIPSSISGGYRYQCSVHSSMVGSIQIKSIATI